MDVAKKQLKTFQCLLHKLYVLKDFRTSFFQDRESYLTALYPNSEEHAILMAVNAQEVEIYAQSLVKKRLGVIKTVIPEFFEEFKGDGVELYTSYAQNQPLVREGKFVIDSISFFEWILKNKKITLKAHLNFVKTLLLHVRFMKQTWGIRTGRAFYDLQNGRDYVTDKFEERNKRYIQVKIGKLVCRNF